MQHIQLIFKLCSTNRFLFLHSSRLVYDENNTVISGHFVQYDPKTMDDKFFRLGTLFFMEMHHASDAELNSYFQTGQRLMKA